MRTWKALSLQKVATHNILRVLEVLLLASAAVKDLKVKHLNVVVLIISKNKTLKTNLRVFKNPKRSKRLLNKTIANLVTFYAEILMLFNKKRL